MAVTSPPTEHPRAPLPAIATAEPRGRGVTLEQALYLAIGFLAVLSHLYLLGDRALHHDETLHAAYSWRIYQGQGYTHDPLLHGPFLYYITALQYLLFGDSDFTARLSAALFGIALTLLPVLLRRDIGRGAALLASGYLLISPVSLYVGRFIRHDIYAVVFELLAVIAIVRYAATERPLWHYVLAAAMGLMLVTLETFFLFLAIIGSFVFVWVIWQVARRLFWLVLAYGAVAGIAMAIVPRWAGPLPLPSSDQALLVRNQPDNNLADYFAKVGGVLGPMLRHPSILLLLLSTALLIGALIALLFVRKGEDGRSAWRHAADTAPRGSLVGALDRIPGRQWAIAFGIAFAIYAVFFTAILSNPSRPNTAGLITGVSGSLLYWLGQHGVRRGNQPPHFYLFLLSVYEPLLYLFVPIGLAQVIARLLPRRGAARPASAPRTTRRIGRLELAPALLAWWSVGALLIYSWAGEKMPWLTIHIVLPLTLLSAWSLARLWSWARRGGFDGMALGLTAAAGLLLLLCFNKLGTTVSNSAIVGSTVVWPMLMLAFLVLLALGLMLLYRSARPAVLALLSLALLFGVGFTMRSAIRLVYVAGDVPIEPLVFVQTSPDVPYQIANLRQASLLRTGKLDLPIRYDNETIWDWYLRNYTDREGSGSSQVGPVDERVQAIFMLTENVAANEQYLDGFVRQQYPLRWWFPECEVYRIPSRDTSCGGDATKQSLLSALLSRPWDSQALASYWNFWFDRKLPSALGSTDWTLLVRPELAAEFGIGSGQEP
jgi:predicted membrane-bound mannosyltransferase